MKCNRDLAPRKIKSIEHRSKLLELLDLSTKFKPVDEHTPELLDLASTSFLNTPRIIGGDGSRLYDGDTVIIGLDTSPDRGALWGYPQNKELDAAFVAALVSIGEDK
jgi:hypothetical protein